MTRLEDKVVVVTGGGRGIGKAIAEKCVAQGAAVVIADLDPALAEQTAAELGPRALAARTDVTARDSIDAMVERTLDRFGHVDVLVNNAGWDRAGAFVDSDPAEWDRVIGVNLIGVLHTCHALVPHLVARGGGSIVNLGSDAGRVGSSGEAVYSAAKGGVIAFTKTLARETARYRIRVNCVCPGPTDTALLASIGADDPALRSALIKAIPFRRLGQPADIANAVVFYASEEAAFITGQTVSVSGGLTMV
jgi:2-hydroxycyclohexanecarboxyl-CoA dehydrogenase